MQRDVSYSRFRLGRPLFSSVLVAHQNGVIVTPTPPPALQTSVSEIRSKVGACWPAARRRDGEGRGRQDTTGLCSLTSAPFALAHNDDHNAQQRNPRPQDPRVRLKTPRLVRRREGNHVRRAVCDPEDGRNLHSFVGAGSFCAKQSLMIVFMMQATSSVVYVAFSFSPPSSLAIFSLHFSIPFSFDCTDLSELPYRSRKDPSSTPGYCRNPNYCHWMWRLVSH